MRILAIALMIGCLLSWLRGGFAVWLFIVFFLSGLLAVVGWHAAFDQETLSKIEVAVKDLPFQAPIRYALAVGALASLAIWAGPIMASAGFGGWLVAVLMWLIAPAFVCILAPRFPVVFGILAAAFSVFSIEVENSRLYSRRREIQWQYLFSDHTAAFFFLFALAAVLSLLISIRIQTTRRRLST
jgi:hypothetical protein